MGLGYDETVLETSVTEEEWFFSPNYKFAFFDAPTGTCSSQKTTFPKFSK